MRRPLVRPPWMGKRWWIALWVAIWTVVTVACGMTGLTMAAIIDDAYPSVTVAGWFILFGGFGLLLGFGQAWILEQRLLAMSHLASQWMRYTFAGWAFGGSIAAVLTGTYRSQAGFVAGFLLGGAVVAVAQGFIIDETGLPAGWWVVIASVAVLAGIGLTYGLLWLQVIDPLTTLVCGLGLYGLITGSILLPILAMLQSDIGEA